MISMLYEGFAHLPRDETRKIENVFHASMGIENVFPVSMGLENLFFQFLHG